MLLCKVVVGRDFNYVIVKINNGIEFVEEVQYRVFVSYCYWFLQENYLIVYKFCIFDELVFFIFVGIQFRNFLNVEVFGVKVEEELVFIVIFYVIKVLCGREDFFVRNQFVGDGNDFIVGYIVYFECNGIVGSCSVCIYCRVRYKGKACGDFIFYYYVSYGFFFVVGEGYCYFDFFVSFDKWCYRFGDFQFMDIFWVGFEVFYIIILVVGVFLCYEVVYVLVGEDFLDQVFVDVIIVEYIGCENGVMFIFKVWVVCLKFYIVYDELDGYIIFIGVVYWIRVLVVFFYESLVEVLGDYCLDFIKGVRGCSIFDIIVSLVVYGEVSGVVLLVDVGVGDFLFQGESVDILWYIVGFVRLYRSDKGEVIVLVFVYLFVVVQVICCRGAIGEVVGDIMAVFVSYNIIVQVIIYEFRAIVIGYLESYIQFLFGKFVDSLVICIIK